MRAVSSTTCMNGDIYMVSIRQWTSNYGVCSVHLHHMARAIYLIRDIAAKRPGEIYAQLGFRYLSGALNTSWFNCF